MKTALIIGAGPAGLMAAQMLADAGAHVVLCEAKTSAARKFLMAGKSGLNLTKAEPMEQFLAAYGPERQHLLPMLQKFGPTQMQDWARDLGVDLFTGSSGRVFPTQMKASPLLRAWLQRLQTLGVELRTGWRWLGGTSVARFQTPEGPQEMNADVTVLACGGASWARLGSDGAWAEWLPADAVAPFQPANMGFRVDWSPHMQKHFGQPVKTVTLSAGETRLRAEFVISQTGIEGGGIYAVSRAMREGAPLFLDLLPDLSQSQLRQKLSRPRGKMSLFNFLRKSLKLDPVKQALLFEFGRPLPPDLAPLLKSLRVEHLGPNPIDQAISTAGGVRFEALNEGLMFHGLPGVFAAGEMLDWEAPTGGYLLTACLATGRWAGEHAARYLELPMPQCS